MTAIDPLAEAIAYAREKIKEEHQGSNYHGYTMDDRLSCAAAAEHLRLLVDVAIEAKRLRVAVEVIFSCLDSNTYGALSHLPAGGLECEALTERAVEVARAALAGPTRPKDTP